MTRLTAKMKCDSCGGLLVPPEMLSGVTIPKDTDYVCLKCSRPYQWIGDPPRLATVPTSASDAGTDDDQ
jgi:hypothetical protein